MSAALGVLCGARYGIEQKLLINLAKTQDDLASYQHDRETLQRKLVEIDDAIKLLESRA